MKNFLLLSFISSSVDFGLLVLRLATGAVMLLFHGWPKLLKFSTMFNSFPDPLGFGHRTSYVLATGGEVIGSLMIIFGLFTRLGSLWLGSVMAVAFFVVHDAALTGKASGELAFVYFAACAALLVAGGGRFSFDAKIGAK